MCIDVKCVNRYRYTYTHTYVRTFSSPSVDDYKKEEWWIMTRPIGARRV